MKKLVALVAFIGVLSQTGNIGGALVGAGVLWLFLSYLWAPVKIQRYDGLGNRDDNGPYTTPH